MTDDLSQCGNCIYHYTYNGRDMCKQVGDDFYLQWKVENCPYHTSITKVAAISDEIYRLKAENAALRSRLEKAVEFPFENLDKVFILAGEYTTAKQFIPDRIVEGTIVGFGYDIYEWVDGNYKFNYHVLVGENNYIFALEQFNKTLFKTREAAEARLKELEVEE